MSSRARASVLRRDPVTMALLLLMRLSPRTAPLSLFALSFPTSALIWLPLAPFPGLLLKDRLPSRPLKELWRESLSWFRFACWGWFSTEPGLSAEPALTWLTPGESCCARCEALLACDSAVRRTAVLLSFKGCESELLLAKVCERSPWPLSSAALSMEVPLSSGCRSGLSTDICAEKAALASMKAVWASSAACSNVLAPQRLEVVIFWQSLPSLSSAAQRGLPLPLALGEW